MSILPFYTKALRLNTNNILTYGKVTLHSHLKCYTFSLWEITQYMPSQNMTHYYSDQVCVSVKRASLVSELEISEKAIFVIIIAILPFIFSYITRQGVTQMSEKTEY